MLANQFKVFVFVKLKTKYWKNKPTWRVMGSTRREIWTDRFVGDQK